MVSVELRGLDAARHFCQALRLVRLGASLGGTHTLVAHPASTTHRQVDPTARAAQGLADGLVRISVGLEDVDDLLADVDRALHAVASRG
jgi:cystathionine beta-lyase/cystathionine gamma-synthase